MEKGVKKLALYCEECGCQYEPNQKTCSGCGADLDSGDRSIPRKPRLLAGRYELTELVKSGAMGCVYKARDIQSGNQVAVKRMFNRISGSEQQEAETSFLREAQILGSLSHDGLPEVFDYFSDKDPINGGVSSYLVMTFIGGEDLETFLKKTPLPLPVNKVVDISLRILDILDYLHTQKPAVIYRDIKPSNIMISGDNIYLVDFGIARSFTKHSRGTQVGTPGYAPPEQYKGFTDVRSDLYSLGVLMHYLITGKNPEDAKLNPFTFEPISDLTPETPDALETLVESMIQILPENRPKNAKEVIEILHGIKKASDPSLLGQIGNLIIPPKTTYYLGVTGELIFGTKDVSARKVHLALAVFIIFTIILPVGLVAKTLSLQNKVRHDDLMQDKVYKYHGINAFQNNDFREAIRLFTCSLTEKPDSEVYKYRASAFIQQGDIAKATGDLRASIALNNNDYMAHYTLGKLLSIDNPEEALKEIDISLKLNPDSREAKEQRKKIIRIINHKKTNRQTQRVKAKTKE